MLSLALASGLLLAGITVPPGAHPRPDAIRALAEAHAVVLVASKRCADLAANSGIDDLPRTLGLSDADAADAYSLLLSRAGEMNARAAEVGDEAWCRDAYDRFGPEGSVVKGLLKRCDPHSSGC